MKKFSKKSMLGLLTASAIVVTTVGSFAVWDTLEATSTGTLSIASPIVVSKVDMGALTETRNWDAVPEYAGEVSFSVEGLADTSGSQLTLAPVLKEGDSVIEASKYTVEITQDGADNGLSGNVDSKVDSTNKYKVVVKPNADATDLGGKSLTLEITGTLAETPAP